MVNWVLLCVFVRLRLLLLMIVMVYVVLVVEIVRSRIIIIEVRMWCILCVVLYFFMWFWNSEGGKFLMGFIGW